MKILFVSTDLVAADLARIMKEEGHDVRLHINDRDRTHCFDNIVEKTSSWKKDVKWVGKDGLIVFDNTGFGRIQDQLRKKGYSVVGGTELGEKLELVREFGQEIFQKYGLLTYPLKDFDDLDDAIMFAQENPRPWVIKQNGHETKMINYVSELPDGRDTISLLKNYLQNKTLGRERITLHERIQGIEIGIARFFNGKEWVGPIEHNVEHPKFMPNDVGPMTSEMGTVAWYTEHETKLYTETLKKIEPFLRESNFKGDAALNCIVNENGAYILEATMRFGTPIAHLQAELQLSPWGEALSAVARGESYNLEMKKGYGIVVLLAVPPFPYSRSIKNNPFFGVSAYFDQLSKEEMKHVHFDGIAKRTGTDDQYFIATNDGYIAYVTGHGETIADAQKAAYNIISKITIPKMMYRNDIGTKFALEQQPKLTAWGWI